LAAGTSGATISWQTVVLWIMAAGVVAKLGWLAIGILQLRRYRTNAASLLLLPESVREARRLTGADARFCLSPDVSGPATMGHIDPVVLLPDSFQSLEADCQRSIACHELLHVRRKDWLVTVAEEMVGALLWFNPGAWWLIAQAKLAREQLVDSEVVKLTAPEPYIEALLSMAVVPGSRWALPAAPFFTGGHLIRRMRLLTANARCSRLRLFLSYASIGLVLFLVAGSMFLWFPLMGEQQVVLAGPPTQRVFLGYATAPIGVIGGFAGTRVSGEFNVALPAPAGPVHDIVYFVSTMHGDAGLMPPPPPPPPPPGMLSSGFLAVRGIQMVRPGEVASPERIQQMREALGDGSVVEIDQTEGGFVRGVRVTARRLSNEADTVRSVVPAGSTKPAAPADRID
ncbi:MAG TPA: M56 family metallopeptidase, partial [Terriglobia bacterium]|nr:M56 family metallopeptidase [Terriglobia bacterium]